MSTTDIISALRELLKPDQIVTDASELFVYESDGFTIANARPGALVFPTTVDEVVAVVKLLRKWDVQIVPRGSGTGLAGGCVAFEQGVIISTVRLNKIHKIDIENRVAHVESGVRNTALSEAVARLEGGAGYHFAPDPSSQRASTIGGNAATNAGGIHTLKDFVSSNHVIGIEMVTSDGEILRCGGQNGAYETGEIDLPAIICASEGTLGIITGLWVRLAPRRTSFRTVVAIFSSTVDACNAVSDIIASGQLPAAMEMLDGQMVQVIEDAFHFGFPRSAQALLLVEIDGVDALLDAQMDDIDAICRKNNADNVEKSADPYRRAALWKVRKSAFGAIGRISHSYCTQDACIPRSKLGEALAHIDKIGKRYGLQIPNVFHAGDGNIHPIFLYDDRDEDQVQNALYAATEVLKYCIDLGGTLTGEHGVGVEKLHLMPYLFDTATMNLFGNIKHAFDPEERINAGKLVPSEKIVVELVKPGRQVPQ